MFVICVHTLGTTDHVPPEWKSHYTYRAGTSTVWQMGVVLFDSLHGVAFETTKFLRKKLRIKNELSKGKKNMLICTLISRHKSVDVISHSDVSL